MTRILAKEPLRRAIRLEASLDREKMSLTINGESVGAVSSPGLIPVQPQDEFSVGRDTQSAAGNYVAPNPFNGTVISTRVDTGGKPPAITEPMRRKDIRAGLKSHDRALFLQNDWIRDPYIVLGPDDYYYLTGTAPLPGDPREKGDPYNTGLGKESIVGWKAHVWRSQDLIAWEDLGTPFSLKDGVWFQDRPGAFDDVVVKQWRLWAPELHWLGDKWALIHTSPSPVKGANFSLTQGISVKGPWSNPIGAKIQRRHDPSLFKDDDGTRWMIWGATSIARLKPDFSDFASKAVEIGPSGDMAKMGHEGCLIQKIHGKYVLFGTGWSTGLGRRGSYNLYYATADKITGPYSERKFAGRFLGHGTPFKDKQGRWWCTAFYNANVTAVSRDGIRTADLGATAQTINQRGTTLVPLDVRLLDDGELHIRAIDPDYATPGPDEAQDFGMTKVRS
ncbi:MAG: family 43 glycosylhydrolase [Fuerstiella sp.]